MHINVEYSTQHWIFPIITIGILVILGVLLIALEGRARIKAGKGFTFWSIICLFLFNTLFANKAQLKNPRYHITSLIISVVACLIISVVFGTAFAITLPSGLLTIEIPSLGFILY